MTPVSREHDLAVAMTTQGMMAKILPDSFLTLSNLVAEMDRSPLIFNPASITNVFSNNGFLPIAVKNNGRKIAIFACCMYRMDPLTSLNIDKPLTEQTLHAQVLTVDDIAVKFEECQRNIGYVVSKENSFFIILTFDQYIELQKNRVLDKAARKTYLNNIDPESAATECTVAILAMAMSLGASDIHIKPDPNYVPPRQKEIPKAVVYYQDDEKNEPKVKADDNIGGAVLFRLLGVMNHAYCLTGVQVTQVVAKLKTMASMKMDEHRLPQDGRLLFDLELVKQNPQYKNYDFRVAVLPTIHGEKVVIRLLKRELDGYDISRLGFPDNQRDQILQHIFRSSGFIPVVGSTGSGKTTTLYTLLSLLSMSRTKNILTAEDPVEMQLSGITQTSINEKMGLTFAVVSRALMRQDPDIILIGEIRDPETMLIASQAAITGHLVFSTLHTSSAMTVYSRIETLGVDPRIIMPQITGVIAQSLTRRLCRYCLEEYDGIPELSRYFDLTGLNRKITLCRRAAPRDCSICSSTGYDKRVVVSEVWFPEQSELDQLCRGDNEYLKVLARAKANGFKPKDEMALALVLDRETSFEEVLRSAVNESELYRDRVDLGRFIVEHINSGK